MKTTEMVQVQQYLRNIFGTERIVLNASGRKDDSAEVYIGEEFIGVLFRDDEDEDETAYQFQMAILAFDLQ